MLWLWLAAVPLIRPLAWEPPYAVSAAIKRQKKKELWFHVLQFLSLNLMRNAVHFLTLKFSKQEHRKTLTKRDSPLSESWMNCKKKKNFLPQNWPSWGQALCSMENKEPLPMCPICLLFRPEADLTGTSDPAEAGKTRMHKFTFPPARGDDRDEVGRRPPPSLLPPRPRAARSLRS